MEEALKNLERKKKPVLHDEFSAPDLASALTKFVEALRESLPLLDPRQSSARDVQSTINANWLLDLCSRVPSELGVEYLAQAVLDASLLANEDQQQAALFDALGASEAAMEVLFEIAANLGEIRQRIKKADLLQEEQKVNLADFETLIDPEEHRLQILRQEALDAAQVAALTKAEAEALNPATSSGATHMVMRASNIQAQKNAEKAAKRAAQALKKAREAGAIVDESELMTIDNNQMGGGGLMGMSQEQVWELQQSLLPEGSRAYYDKQGLPKGTTRVHEGNLERVIIPAARRDEETLRSRLKISEIMSPREAIAFSGTASLNPMQSTVFEIAFHTRQNMLICAPTGAGKVCVLH
jgi:hypothetical protein